MNLLPPSAPPHPGTALRRFALYRGVVWLLLLGITSGALAPAATMPVSVTSQVGLSGSGSSFTPSFSADSRWVVFVSQANNLVTNDNLGPNLDVFVHEIATGRTTLASVSTNGAGGATADASSAALSGDGRRVIFASAAGNLTGRDTNDVTDIFVRDLVSSETWLASVGLDGFPPPTRFGGTRHPLVSSEGWWVFYQSSAPNLVTNADVGVGSTDVYARDLRTGKTTLVSVNLDGSRGAVSGPGSELCSITPDGRLVAFVSTSANLTPDWMPSTNLYVRDLNVGITIWASSNVASFFPGVPYRCLHAALSADGRFLAFRASRSPSHPDAPVLLFRHELATGLTALIASNVTDLGWPQISADGRFVGYDDGTNVFVWDSQTSSNSLVSVSRSGVPANGVSKTPALTPDGRYVAFVSSASDLVANSVPGTFQVYVRDLVEGTTRLVTLNREGIASHADHEFTEPAVSSDGRWVAFESDDEELVPADFNRASDVFLRDLTSESTRLLSQRHPALPARTGVQHCGVPTGNCVSADGRWAAFTSLDNTLLPGDTNGWQDIMVRDLFTGSARLVGLGTNAVVNPILSADGRFLLFTKPLSLFTSPHEGEVYCHYLGAGITTLVNVRWDSSGPSSAPALAAGISADGRYVLFQSTASDLISGGTSAGTNVFLRDMQLGTNLLISTGLAGGYGNSHSFGAVMNSSARWILFLSRAGDLATNYLPSSNPELFLRDRGTGLILMLSRTQTSALGCSGRPVLNPVFGQAAFTSLTSPGGSRAVYLYFFSPLFDQPVLVADGAINPSLSAHLTPVVYQTWQPQGPEPFTNQIMLADLSPNPPALVSVNRAGTGPASRHSTAPIITYDGRFVVFSSRATDLVDSDTNGVADIFVRDLLTSNTLAVTLSPRAGSTANGVSGPFNLGTDGRTVLFQSFASDLVDGDYNDKADVFLLRLGASDTDNDSMDDDWEMTFFNTLGRQGEGDFDLDGASDLHEFRAGTDPTNQGSVLRVAVLLSLSGGPAAIFWPATADRSYQAQYKDELSSGPWVDLDGHVVINGATASVLDPTAAGQSRRFYRVLLRP